MTIRYRFPFCVISNFGIAKTATGSVTITETRLNISTSVEFNEFPAGTWQDQTATGLLDIEMAEDLLFDSELLFNITCSLGDSDLITIVHAPELVHTQTVDAYILPKQQKVVDTDFSTTNTWHNLPISNGQLAQVVLRTHVQETEKTVLENLAKGITFRKLLTYVPAEPTKPGMTLDENIEYYLGKDRLRNLYFAAEIPAAWSIPARIQNPASIVKASSVGFFKGDTTEYHYNNLGYRSRFDYVTEELLEKRTVLCLGDSDSFGIGVEHNKIWPNLLDTDATVLNLSVPGISTDGLARIVTQTVQALGSTIDAVLIHYPSMSLREFVSKRYKGGVHTHRNYNLPYKDWWDHIDWQSNNYNFNKNRLLMENVCARYKVAYHDLYINRDDKKVPFDFVEYGVYSSIGPHTHRAIANYFSRKLRNQPSLFQSLQS
jgi:hypothetical protein